MTENPHIARPHRDATPPSPWVVRWLPPARAGASLLDFACGAGRHARLGQTLGYQVEAVDRDELVLADLQRSGVSVRQEDLEHGRWPWRGERFEVVVCTHYLFRPRLDWLADLLSPGGRLIYETFAIGQERFGRPSNPAFLLRPGELLDFAQRTGLHVMAYEDGLTAAPRMARVQRLVALRMPLPADGLALA